MARSFSIQRGTARIVFGAGSIERLATEVSALSPRRVLLVSTAGRKDVAARLSAELDARSAGVLAIAREHVPIETVSEARAAVEEADADALLAVGGGSAIGLAKAVAVSLDAAAPARRRLIAVPTTY